jgi:hypothetical protein
MPLIVSRWTTWAFTVLPKSFIIRITSGPIADNATQTGRKTPTHVHRDENAKEFFNTIAFTELVITRNAIAILCLVTPCVLARERLFP